GYIPGQCVKDKRGWRLRGTGPDWKQEVPGEVGEHLPRRTWRYPRGYGYDQSLWGAGSVIQGCFAGPLVRNPKRARRRERHSPGIFEVGIKICGQSRNIGSEIGLKIDGGGIEGSTEHTKANSRTPEYASGHFPSRAGV